MHLTLNGGDNHHCLIKGNEEPQDKNRCKGKECPLPAKAQGVFDANENIINKPDKSNKSTKIRYNAQNHGRRSIGNYA